MPRCLVVVRSFVVGAVVMLPAVAHAQEATVSGRVTDSTGGVLPGAVVTAVHEASGNTFEAVTDDTGAYRLPLRPGVFRITVALTGFATLTRTGVQLLLGQQAVVNLEMSPATLEESVLVSGEAPLLATTTSGLGGNIDPVQMEELPLSGRNWMDLAMLAPGSRQNESSGAPLMRLNQNSSQINVDGQQVTTNFVGLGEDQPRFSRDVIAEFELLTNRFDATMGRSSGMMVNAITKSGTNVFMGSVAGYFRDDRFNAADHVQNRVLPYSNQQVSTTFGGPIKRDRVHFFTNYEYEREPRTLAFNTPYPEFNIDLQNTRSVHTGGARADIQFSSQTRSSLRVQRYNTSGWSVSPSAHPSATLDLIREATNFLGSLTRVIGSRSVNEVRGGVSFFRRLNEPVVRWAGGNFPNADTWSIHTGVPLRLQLRGLNVGSALQFHDQNKYSLRNDFSTSFTKGGRHSLRTGAEYIYTDIQMRNCASGCSHRLVAQGGPVPANVASLLPVWDDASTWNYDGFASVVQRYDRVISDVKGFLREIPQHNTAVWVQDDWTVGDRLTLNLGLRWDVQTGVFESFFYEPIYPGNLSPDLNNFAPRLGFAYTVSDRTVIRGGYGKFFVEGTGDEAHSTLLIIQGAVPETLNDGRPDFPSNPFNGPDPTVAEIRARDCWNNGNAPGCLRTDVIPEHVDRWYETPYSHQASIGVQHQFGAMMAVETNYVYTGSRGEPFQQNLNLSYDAATGANYPYTDIGQRPVPEFGRIQQTKFMGWSNYHGWETSFTKRMSNRWQASATYTLSRLRDARPVPMFYEIVDGWLDRRPLGFDVAPDMGGDYTPAATDQRHRAVFNGIWEVGGGFQLSGLYFYGSGQRFSTTAGADRRLRGVTGEDRLRADGSIMPRNALTGQPIHRVDLRLQQRLRLGGRRAIDGILEVFNLFNRANYGSYTTNEASANFGLPTFNTNIAYQPRAMQVGFRFAF